MNAPHTYSQWADILKVLKQGSNDEEALQAMKIGSIYWQSGVAERFMKRLTDVVNTRINDSLERFNKNYVQNNYSEMAIIQGLLNLRREFSFLLNAVDLQAIPSEYRDVCRQMILDEAHSRQKSLEESAKGERSGKLLNIIKQQRIDRL